MTRHRHWIALGAACWIASCASTGNAPAGNQGTPVAATRVGCVSQTGSLINRPGTGCNAPGHSYSQSDIAKTGETTIAGALGYLDPTIVISH
jgi:hypothetical protein